MKYKPQIEKVMLRYKAFWANDIADRPPIRVRYLTDAMSDNDWSDALAGAKTHCDYWESYVAQRAELEDDEIPNAALDMGPAFMPAVMGGGITFGSGSSWSNHIVKGAEDVQRLREVRFDRSNEMIDELLTRAEYFAQRAEGKFAVGLAMLTGGADILGSLRGITEAYADICEDEALFSEILEICTSAWIAVQKLQMDAVPQFFGGYCDNYGIWSPGRSTYFADDLASCVSPKTYRDILFGQDSRMAQSLDCPWIHTHALHARLIPELIKLPNLQAIQIVNDGISGPGLDEVFSFAKLVQESGKRLILRKYTMDELSPYLPQLSAKGLLIDTQCAGFEQAREILNDFTSQKYMKF